MNSYNRTKNAGPLSPTVLLVLGAILTIAIIWGIKFLVVGDTGESVPPVSGQDAIFRDERPGGAAPAGLPAHRSEATSGDSLDIFTKANVGYSAEESSSPAEAKPAVPAAAKKAAGAAGGRTKAFKDAKTGRTAIPRLQGVKPFGTAAPDKSKNGAMPDMSEMMKQAAQEQGSGD